MKQLKNNDDDITLLEILFGLFCLLAYVFLCLYVSVIFYATLINHNYVWPVVSVILFAALTIGIRWLLPRALKDFKGWLDVKRKSA
ncbi:hypothetical protein [Bacillus haynesii]|uniref:hypothetical protein n=1 Tax=Bacillus haynesii TaxID=1925021 RepID=UPI0022825689|nr:hypothetical protein [Bacillus haynesii]MCY8393408.1 hypothetical protein [Bacillus haynesii]MEC0756375.1 hypothetical protein [Bacillus haynesii]